MANSPVSNTSGGGTYTAETPGQFDDGRPLLVERGSEPRLAVVLVTPGNEVGVFDSKLQGGLGDNRVIGVTRLVPGNVLPIVASGAIAAGDDVSAAAGGFVVAGAANKIGTNDGADAADGDIIQVLVS